MNNTDWEEIVRMLKELNEELKQDNDKAEEKQNAG
jgi:hypothetical protein